MLEVKVSHYIAQAVRFILMSDDLIKDILDYVFEKVGFLLALICYLPIFIPISIVLFILNISYGVCVKIHKRRKQ